METTVKQHIEHSLAVVNRVEQWTVYPIDAQFLHAILGMVDEVGELDKTCKDRMFYDKKIAPVEIMEEMGDLWYYFTLALQACARLWCCSVSDLFETVLRVNDAKLSTRYKEGYTHQEALNRDRKSERDAMVAACCGIIEAAWEPKPLCEIDILGKTHNMSTVKSGG